MGTADLLVEKMFSWIKQRENCAKKLKELADELETLREKCNAAECVGSTASVLGAAGVIAAGVATFFTAGAAAPALALAGGIVGGAGAAVSVTTKIVEHFSSSDTLKDAEKIEEENNKTAERIQNLFERLKAEVRRMYPSADPDQLDRYVMTSFMGAVARRSGLRMNIDFSQYERFYRKNWDSEQGINRISIDPSAMAAGLTIACGIFTVFSLRTTGKQSKFLIAEATKQLIKEMSSAGLKTAIKGGAMVVGGAVGMGFALPEAIDNWKDMIENNHETKASRSLRDTADDILKMCRTLKKQFDNMRTALEEMDRRQREEEERARRQREEEERARRQREEQEKARRRREEQERARRQREEMMARRRREEEERARRQREEEVMARRQREEQEKARKQIEEEEKEEARRRREEEVMARRQREEELMARRRREEEVMARRRREEEEKARKQIEEEEKENARRQREEEVTARRQREEEEKARKQIEEEKEKARRRREEEVTARRRREEEEKARKQMEEEKEKARRRREEEVTARRRREEEEKARKQIEEEKEKARRQREEEVMARRRREEEVMARIQQKYEMLIRQQKPKEKLIGKKNPVQEKSVNLLTQTYQRHVIKQCDQSEQTGREQQKDSQQTGGEQQKNSQQTGGEQQKNNQQTGGEQQKNSQQAEQTGGDQGDEDQERDQEEEESDSEEETEEEESDSEEETEGSHCSNEQILIVDQCDTNQTPPGTIRLALLNTRSMNRRTSRISELITQNNLTVFLPTETWLRDNNADIRLREASPQSFSFHSQVRTDGRRGGGVAIQFSEALRGERIHFDFLNIETFEFVVTVLHHNDWDQPLVIINLYHPPGYNQQRFRRFLDEFQSLLDEVRACYNSIIVTGDFNIHVNNERRSYTDEFDFLLWVNNLTQHVEEPTHEGGNTLDLVITTNVEVSGLFVRDDGVSDHSTVYFNAKPKDTRKKTEENKDEERKRFKRTEE